MTQGDATKAQADRRAPRSPDGIEVSVGRWLGRAARWATHEMDTLAEWTHKVARGDESRRRSRVSASRETLPELLTQLVELVSTRSPEGVAALARDPRFWSLIGRLHVRRPRTVPHKPAPTAPANARAPGAPSAAEASSVAQGAPAAEPSVSESVPRDSVPPSPDSASPPSPDSTSPLAADGEVLEAALVPLGPVAIEATSHEPTSSALEVIAPAETALATRAPSSEEALVVRENSTRALVAEVTSATDAPAGARSAPAPEGSAPDRPSADEEAGRDEKGGSTEP